ncbi:hypothetical protein BGZ46_000543 [Entomortierella lignicola]|nr:hypothetical protein BGZ46_000543 [Entomortierella lignicola]
MPRPSQVAQDPAMPSTPRTPTAKVLGARKSAQTTAEDFKVPTPRAPRTPTQPLILHDPTSPSPMPMLRSRRDTSLPLLAQTIMGGLRSDQQINQPIDKTNGVSILEEDESELEARRLSSTDSSFRIQRRLIVSIPINQNKRALEVDASHSSNEETKHQRLSQNTRTRRDPNFKDSRKELISNSNITGGVTENAVEDSKIAETQLAGNLSSMRSTRSRTAGMRTKLQQDGNMESESLESLNKDLEIVSETATQDSVDQGDSNIEIEGTTVVEDNQGEAEAPDDPEVNQDDILNNIESDLEDSEIPEVIPDYVRKEMEEFEQGFNGLQGKFKLLDKIGEGTFSSVYKAIDLEYDSYDNSQWDYSTKERPPEVEQKNTSDSTEKTTTATSAQTSAVETGKIVAIKRIYVTSSPRRIENEITILHGLSGHKNVIPLITAFRFKDQVIAVLPYFEHSDFRKYYYNLPMDDIRCYFRALLNGLVHVHKHGIIHRDIKPSNFLYNTETKTGVIVDFGLAHRQIPWPPKSSGRSSKSKSGSAKSAPSNTNATNTEAPKSQDFNTKNNLSNPSETDPALLNPKLSRDYPSSTPPLVASTSVHAGSSKAMNIGLTHHNRIIATPSSHRKLEGAFTSYSVPRAHGRISGSGISAKMELMQPNKKDGAIPNTMKLGNGTPGALNTVAASNHTEINSNSKLDLLLGRKDSDTLKHRKFVDGPSAAPTMAAPISGSITADVATHQGPSVSNIQSVPHPTNQRTPHPPLNTSVSQAPNTMSHPKPRTLSTAPHAIPGNPHMAISMSKREPGYLKKDSRPEVMVNRAGTRGFRAPEVLFRHYHQTSALDIWSVGVILCSFLTGRFPFFNSNDDADSLIEIAILNGKIEMQKTAALFNRSFITNIPSIKDKGLSLANLCRALHPKRFNPPEEYMSPTFLEQQEGTKRQPDSMSLYPRDIKSNDISKKSTSRVPHDGFAVPGSHTTLPNTKMDDAEITEDSVVIVNMEEEHNDGASETSNSDKNKSSSSSSDNNPKKVHIVGTDSQEDLEEAVNLLERLLDLNPKRRITASQALKHPFLAKKGS